jgi:hypothetical protein
MIPAWLRGLLVRAESASYARVHTANKSILSGYLIGRGHQGLHLKSAPVVFEGQPLSFQFAY